MLNRWQGSILALALVLVLNLVASGAVQASPSGADPSQPILVAKAEKGTITGTISQWGSDSFTLKVGAVDWKFKYDAKKFMTLGKPAVGVKAKVWYREAGADKMATKLEVKAPKK